MQILKQVSVTDSASWYRLEGDYQGEVNRWVVSTPSMREIANCPEVCGYDFTLGMQAAMADAMSSAPFLPFLQGVSSCQLTILKFLRGGLNFALRHALWKALGSNHHVSCFMSSQRHRTEGRWVVREDMYRKIKIPRDAVILVGDVVATGVTVDNGLEVVLRELLEKKTPIQGMVFFTIGCHKAEKILDKYHALFKQEFPGYRETHVIYLEGKMRLVDSQIHLSNSIQGTDLIKTEALLAPEFEASQYDSLSAPLERCVIYDAGSRAFDVLEYLDDVEQYWSQVSSLAERGWTLREVLKERWPEEDYSSWSHFRERQQERWKGVDEAFLRMLWARYEERWNALLATADTAEALKSLCEEQLDKFKQVRLKAGGLL